jgi:hypothetical protein
MLKARIKTYHPEEIMLLAGLQRAFDMAWASAEARARAQGAPDGTPGGTSDEFARAYREELERVKIVLMAEETPEPAAPTDPPAGASATQPPATTEPPSGAPTQDAEITPPKRGRRKTAEAAPPGKDSTDQAQLDLLANHGIPSEAPKPEKAVAEVTVVGERKESRAAQAPAAALEVFPTTEAVQESIKDAYNRLVAKGKGQGAAMNEVRGVLAEFKIDRGAACPEKERAALIARLGPVGA